MRSSDYIMQLEFEASKGNPEAAERLIAYRESQGFCYICGDQGVIKCCSHIRCGLHAEEHLSQHRSIKNLKRRNPPDEQKFTFERNQTLFQAAKELGVSHGAIRLWIKNYRAPCSLKPNSSHGGPVRYMVNTKELMRWLKKEAFHGRIRSKLVTKKAKVGELQALLFRIQRKLGWTKAEIAKELEVKQINTYLHPHLYEIQNAPLSLILKAEMLLKTGRKKRHPWTDPSLQEVTKAIKKSGGLRERASKLLHITLPKLNRLVDKYDLYHLLFQHYSDYITPQMLKKEVLKNQGDIRPSAKAFGINSASFYLLLKKAHLMDWLKEVRERYLIR